MVAELLVEIGTEEIPSGYLEGGLRDFGRLAEACLKENRIEMAGGIFTFGTPRRLVLIGKAIADMQADLVEEITGPPKKVCYDEDGKPTKAAVGFAGKQGVAVEDLETRETSRGEYLFVRKKTAGRPTPEILTEALPQLIGEIPWPKSMRWGETNFPFVRPIHWVLALFQGEVIPFDLAGIKSGNTTRGHRFLAPAETPVSGVEDYLLNLEQRFVMIDQSDRRRMVKEITEKAAETAGGNLVADPGLVNTVANLVEYPSAVCGHFDETFLSLPDAVLITAMKEHQKYFSLQDERGRLMPFFITVNNTLARDEAVVQKGNERVLRARLSDAEFFFQEDLKRTLDERLEDLKGVIYQADLGTSYAKVKRFTRLAEYLGETVLPQDLAQIRTTARLCKCDLVTQMVHEFPKLQGVMGMEYAKREGYAEAISSGIHEHYLPTQAGGDLPTSGVGAVVGIADRMDTIVGCFSVGLEPTGSADPFALRRHALAIIRIMEKMGRTISILGLIDKALEILNEEVQCDRDSLKGRVTDFFRERYRQRMLRLGYGSDVIEAVISVEFDIISRLRSRMDQLQRFASDSKEFESLAQTFKRVVNILKKQKESFHVNPDLFEDASERDLWEIYRGLEKGVYDCLEKGDHYEALNLMARLRKPVDDFFEGVEILIKDQKALRENRLGLLQHLQRFFLKAADLSKFSI